MMQYITCSECDHRIYEDNDSIVNYDHALFCSLNANNVEEVDMKPKVHVYVSEIDGHWVVDIFDSPADVRVYVNDAIYPVYGKDIPPED